MVSPTFIHVVFPTTGEARPLFRHTLAKVDSGAVTGPRILSFVGTCILVKPATVGNVGKFFEYTKPVMWRLNPRH